MTTQQQQQKKKEKKEHGLGVLFLTTHNSLLYSQLMRRPNMVKS